MDIKILLCLSSIPPSVVKKNKSNKRQEIGLDVVQDGVQSTVKRSKEPTKASKKTKGFISGVQTRCLANKSMSYYGKIMYICVVCIIISETPFLGGTPKIIVNIPRKTCL